MTIVARVDANAKRERHSYWRVVAHKLNKASKVQLYGTFQCSETRQKLCPMLCTIVQQAQFVKDLSDCHTFNIHLLSGNIDKYVTFLHRQLKRRQHLRWFPFILGSTKQITVCSINQHLNNNCHQHMLKLAAFKC